MSPLALYTNDHDFVIAYDVTDAAMLCRSVYGEDAATSTWRVVDGAEEFLLKGEGTRTVSAWIALKGRCYFASGEAKGTW